VATALTYAGVTVLLGFAATPWLLRWLGAARFGAYKAIIEWFAYVPLFEFGLSGSIVAWLAPAVATGDVLEVRRILSSGFRAYCRVLPLMLLAGAGLAIGLPHLGSFKLLEAGELRTSVLILLIAGLWNPFTIFRSLAEAQQQLYIVNALLAAQSVLTTVLLLAAAWVGWGLPGQSLATILAQAPTVIVLPIVGLRAYRGALSAPHDSGVSKKIWSLNWPTFGFLLSNRFGLLSDNIVVAGILGPAAVVPFYLTQRLATLAYTQLQSVGTSTWAGLIELHACGRFEQFRARLLDLTGLVSGLGIAVLVPIASYNEAFVRRWIVDGGYAGTTVTLLACVNMWLWSVFSLWDRVVSGAGLIGRWLPYAILFAAINGTVSVGATLFVGLPGPLFGTLAGFLLVHTWAMPSLLARNFRVRSYELWGAVLRPLPWALPFAVAEWLLAHNYPPGSWAALLGEIAAGCAAGFTLWWLVTLDAGARLEWRVRVVNAVALQPR
jgi:O-antigen/teichoic acid export membrane protein